MIMRRVGLLVMAAIALLFLLGRPIAWSEAALVVFDVASGGASPWHRVTSPPAESEVSWAGGEGDLYAPAKVRATLVLVPGAAALGRDEPRLQALARTLARAGFAVLVPELPEVRLFALSRRDADRVADAMRHLRRTYPQAPLGTMAVSYAVGPALIAATQPDLAPQLAFAVGIGGYRDSEATIRFMTTGAFRPQGDSREHRVEPNQYGRWAFVLANVGRLGSVADQAPLYDIAQRRWRDPRADISDLARLLGAEGQAVLALVDNRDPDAVTALIEALPSSIRAEIDGLNLALYDLGTFRGHLILLHGRDDSMVPYSESEALAGAVSAARVSLFLIEGIGHVEFNAVNLANGWKMWRAALTLLDERL
jgi:fermentation-respiration switch protein FrsA (DUF1100 family)